MSIYITPSSPFLRPYIGSRRNRHYIHNKLSSSSLFSNDYFFSPKSFLPTRLAQRTYLTNLVPTQVPIECLSSPISLDERQWHQEQKAKEFLSSSSSSRFFFPTTHNVTRSDRILSSSSSFPKEQQNFRYEQQHSHRRALNTENKDNQSFLSEQLQEYQQPSDHNHRFEVNDLTEENNLSSSSCLLNDTFPINNDYDNRSHLITSTPTLCPFSSNKNKSLPKTSNNILDQSSIELLPNHQHKADPWQLNNMSSLRYSSGLGTTTTHHYDQRISDQGDKYIIQLKTDDYQENEFNITPRSSLHQLIIDAKHNEEDSLGGYIRRELHKIFVIPKHIDLNKHKYSYDKNTQELTVEMPYLTIATNEKKNVSSFISPDQNTTQSLTFSYGNLNLNNNGNILPTIASRPDHQNVKFFNNDSNSTSGTGTAMNESTAIATTNAVIPPTYKSSIGSTKPFDFDLFHQSAFRPQITSNEHNNDKKLIMSLDLTDYLPEDIKVSIKDQELIVKAERKIETDTRKSRTSFFQSTSLPPQTDIEHLQSNYVDGKLIIEAPYLDRRIKTSQNHGANEQTVIESEQKSINVDPFQQTTETVTEFVRLRRL